MKMTRSSIGEISRFTSIFLFVPFLYSTKKTLAWIPSWTTAHCSSNSFSCSSGFQSTKSVFRAKQQPQKDLFPSSWILRSALEDTFTDLVTEEDSTNSSGGDGTLLPEYQAALQFIQTELEGKIPEPYQEKMTPLLNHFAGEYMAACQTSMLAASAAAYTDSATESDEIIKLCQPQGTAKRFLTCLQYGLTYGMGPKKFQFGVFHEALRGSEQDGEEYGGTDYMKFGNDFFRPCMDMKNSVVLGQDSLDQMAEQLEQGHNVVFFANHQSEADPQVISCLTESLTKHGKMFEKMIFVAGHKVTTDPLAVPFSMGRNLVCIHSKKHINADPETKQQKQRQNLIAMSGLTDRLKKGGTLLWLAPSGGRDRRDLETGKVPIAPFDRKTVDMFRLISNKAAKSTPTHFYSMALVSYDLCPPPDTVEPGVGEARNVRFVPCGIAIGKECVSTGGLESRDEFTQAVFTQCLDDYNALSEAIQESLSV